MEYSPFILLASIAADAVLGDPPAWPHMVRLMGRAISALERLCLPRLKTRAGRRLGGCCLTLILVGGFTLIAWLILDVCHGLSTVLYWLVAGLISFQCLAAGQLYREASRVARPLARGDLELARRRLGMIVGRDTAQLSARGMRRALIETVAENLNDGFVAPLFYMALFGPMGGVAYKAVNTLDSMVGYKNEAYRDWGWCSARLDDLAGYLPARLCLLMIVAAARLAGMDMAGAWRAARRYGRAHTSPNAGLPEAAYAGALGIRLGGPSRYRDKLVDKPWINPQGRQPTAGDVDACLRLLMASAALSGGLAALVVWI